MADKPVDVESDEELIARAKRCLLTESEVDGFAETLSTAEHRSVLALHLVAAELCRRLESASQRGRLSAGEQAAMEAVIVAAKNQFARAPQLATALAALEEIRKR